MVLELHIWGPAFGLPSIEPECTATVAYCRRVIPDGEWTLVADHNPTFGASESLPILFDDAVATATGFEDIVAYLRNHPAIGRDLDANLTTQQQTDRIALVTWLQSTATLLIDLSLYVSAENYNTTTSSAYTAILPWYANYTIPPKRRDLARARTVHMGLSSLDLDPTAEEAFAPGRGTASAEYEAAKRAAGIPTESRPNGLNMGRGKGLGGLFSGPMYAARFKLDALSSEVMDSLQDVLGKHDFIFRGSEPSSLDCLAFGYLSLMYYPQVPQPWLKETIHARYPSIERYIHNMRRRLLQDEITNPAVVWSISTGSTSHEKKTLLPWQSSPRSFSSHAWNSIREIFGNVPGVAPLVTRHAVVHSPPSKISRSSRSELPSPLVVNSFLSAITLTSLGLFAWAIQHRRSPREGPLIFWAIRPSKGFGEAENILSILAPQLPSYGQY